MEDQAQLGILALIQLILASKMDTVEQPMHQYQDGQLMLCRGELKFEDYLSASTNTNTPFYAGVQYQHLGNNV